jgi:hypothetical protein
MPFQLPRYGNNSQDQHGRLQILAEVAGINSSATKPDNTDNKPVMFATVQSC